MTAARPQLVAPATRETPPQSVADILNSAATAGKLAAVATKFLPAERLLRLAISAVRKTPLLAQCDPATFMGAIMSSSTLGLEPNTPQQLAYLIPYKARRNVRGDWVDVYECQFQIGYRGFIDLMYRQPYIVEVHSEAVRANDTFDAEKGTTTFLRHKKALVDRGDIVGSFCFTKLKDGQSFTVLDRDQIDKARSKSETFNALNRRLDDATSENDRKKAQAKLNETPWVMWDDDMAAKTAIKKHGKALRLAPDVALAADIDGIGGVSIDLSRMADPDFAKAARDGGETVVVEEPQQLEHSAERPMATVHPVQTPQPEPAPAAESAPPARGRGNRAQAAPKPRPVPAPQEAVQEPPPADAGDPGPQDRDDPEPAPPPPPAPAAARPKDIF